MEKELSLSEMIENAKRQEELRKEDEEVQALNARIDEAEQRIIQMEVDKQIKNSLARDEGYFTTS